MIALRSLEQGRFATNQIRFNGSITEGLLYLEGLPRFFSLGLVKRLKLLRSLKACFLW
ncbi:MAG: hypothetical protein J7K71_01770 [Candidatus Omnitrophica bacterium]|nr:hypothetical protein [Candidatus Omnitrophota bacterium]